MSEPQAFLEEHGWVVLKGVLTSDEAHRLTQAYDTLIDPNISQPSTTDVVQLTQPHLRHPVFAENLRHKRLWRMVTKALRWESAQLLQDVLLFRTAPSTGRVEWHCDHTYTSFLDPPILASARVALTHSKRTSGCLHVLDMSHQREEPVASDIFGTRIDQGGLESLTGGDDSALLSRVKPLELEPGDVSIHLSKTLHASFENESSKEQKVMVHHIFDARCRLDPSKLPDTKASVYFPVTAEGHLDPKQFPILG